MDTGHYRESIAEREARIDALYREAREGLRLAEGQLRTLREGSPRPRPPRGRWMSEPLTKAHAAGFVVGWVAMDVALSLAGLR